MHPSEAVSLIVKATRDHSLFTSDELDAASEAIGSYADALSPTECSQLLHSSSTLNLKLSAQAVAFLLARSSSECSVFGPPLATNVFISYVSAAQIAATAKYPFPVVVPPLIFYPGSAEDVPIAVIVNAIEALQLTEPPSHLLAEISRQCEERAHLLNMDDVLRALHIATHYGEDGVTGCLLQVVHARHSELSPPDLVEVLTVISERPFPVVQNVLRNKLLHADMVGLSLDVLLSYASLCHGNKMCDAACSKVSASIAKRLEHSVLDKGDLMFLLSAACSGPLAAPLQRQGQQLFDNIQLCVFNSTQELDDNETLDALLCIGRWSQDAKLLPAFPAVDALKCRLLSDLVSESRFSSHLIATLELLTRFFSLVKRYFYLTYQDRRIWEEVQRTLTKAVPSSLNGDEKAALRSLSLELVECGLVDPPQIG